MNAYPRAVPWAALWPSPVIDGVVTCPLHGLRIDAATGVVLEPKEKGTTP